MCCRSRATTVVIRSVRISRWLNAQFEPPARPLVSRLSDLRSLTMRKGLKVASILLCTLPSVAFARDSMEATAAKLSRAYLGVWSSNSSAAMRQVSFIYGSRVRFYGRLLSRSDLHAEKRRFIQRWPIRRYALRPGTVRVTCAGPNARCTVRGVLDWRTESPSRGVEAHGSSRFVQAFDFSRGRPLIVSESGSVLKRARRTTRG